jgi:tetratricopeptide (TPR) repeat protein
MENIPENKAMDESKNTQINMFQRRSYKLFMEKKFEEAIKDLEQLITLNDDPTTKSGYMNNIAMCYGEMKNYELEEKYFLDAVITDPNNINALNGLSAFYLKKGDTKKAKEYLTKVLSIKPDDAIARNKLDSLNMN